MTFRPLPAWPYEPQKPRPATYQSTYQATLYDLEDELRHMRAHDVILGVVCSPNDVRLDGQCAPTRDLATQAWSCLSRFRPGAG